MYLTVLKVVNDFIAQFNLQFSAYELDLLLKLLDDNKELTSAENDRLDKIHQTLYGSREKLRRQVQAMREAKQR